MNTRKEFKWFTITQYEQEAEYLRTMHRQGWKLTRVTFPGFYSFEQCEPEDVVYQLDYNQEGVAHKAEYTQLFADCGWEYLFDFVGYSYFRKPAAAMQGEESIFCDDESRLAMLKRIFTGRLLPLLVIFCAIILPQLAMQAGHLDEPFRVFLFALYITLLAMYAGIFCMYGSAYYQMKKKVNDR